MVKKPAPVQKLGRYTLVRSLGAGGMAELFLARADGIGGFAKLVALKRILGHKASNERFIRMLLNEARLVATLDHPNIAQVYDIGVDNDEYFFAMEYVHGQDLRHVLHAAPGHRLQLENALHVAVGVCAGLHHAHEARDPEGKHAGIVHRDVSPSNVLIAYQGVVKLVDFGVAKAASFVSETREGIIKGKYGYMSPEQCTGRALDGRSDLFAVGIMLWEMTVGRRLYAMKGELATLERVVYADAPRPSRFIDDYPPDLERIVMRALARDPDKRYATAEQMQLELENFAVDHRIPISGVSMAMEMRKLFRHRVDAWQEAQQHGRSLIDHLAEISSEDALQSGDEGDELDAVLDDLGRPSTVAGTPAAIRAPVPPAPTVPIHVPVRSRPWLVWILVLFVLAASGVAAWALLLRDPPPAPAPVTAPAGDATPVIETVATIAIDAAPEPAPEPEPEEVVVEEPADAAIKKRPRVPKRVEHAAVEEAPTPTDAPAAEPPKPPPVDAAVPAKPVGPAPGSVDAGEVRAVVRSHLSEISSCVSRAKMENRDLAGRVTLRIDLAASGKVTSTAVSASTGATPALEACLRKAVATWTFPAPAGNTRATITYPFAF